LTHFRDIFAIFPRKLLVPGGGNQELYGTQKIEAKKQIISSIRHAIMIEF
jgi:hypothetical protein